MVRIQVLIFNDIIRTCNLCPALEMSWIRNLKVPSKIRKIKGTICSKVFVKSSLKLY